MFAKFNYTMWPTVSINLEGPIGGEDDFNFFFFQWENLYERIILDILVYLKN